MAALPAPLRRNRGSRLAPAIGFLPLFLSLIAPATGQPPPDGPPRPIRVSNYSVAVDVVVTDRGNRCVKNLSLEDFVLLEDGVPQDLESLESTYDETVEADGPVGRSTGDGRDGALVTPAARVPGQVNLMVVLLDYATIQHNNQTYVRDAAVNFVRQRMRPSDLVAVFRVDTGLKFLQGFTSDKQALQRALDGSHSRGSIYAADQAGLAALADSSQDQVELLTTQIESLGSFAGESAAAAGQAAILQAQLEKIQALEGLYYSQLSQSREQQSRPVIGAVRTIAEGVRHIPGRKTLILFSEGFSVPRTLEDSLYRAVESANRSNLAVYAIDAGGLRTGLRGLESELYDISAGRPGDRVKAYGGLSQFDRAREIGSDQKEGTLRFLATATGGFLVRNTNDFGKALERVEEEIRGRYLLTYQPKDLRFDGGFREIAVRVRDRDDLKVRARKGYWAVPAGAAVLSAEEYRSLIRPEPVSGEGALEVFAQPSHFLSDAGDYQVLLTVEIPIHQLQIQTEEGRSFAHLQLIGLVQNEGGESVTSFRGPSRFAVRGGGGDETALLRLQSTVHLRPGKYALLIGASDPVGKRAAMLRKSLLLPEIAQSEPTLSSLVVAAGMAAGAVPDSNLTVEGYQVLPSAIRRFGNDQRMVFYLNLYRPSLESGGRLDMTVSLMRGGRPVRRMVETIAGGQLEDRPVPHLKVARFLDLEGLSEGRYLLRTEFHDRARNRRLTAQTSFQIKN